MNLLIVNDEVYVAEMMKEDIPWHLCDIENVYIANETGSARRCILENKIDIMLCDIEMPGENGISLLRWVRENQIDLECVFLTCHANFTYAREAIELDCQNYLVLPVKDEDIVQELQKVIKRIRGKRELERYVLYGKKALKEQSEQLCGANEVRKNARELTEEIVQYIYSNLCKEELDINHVSEYFYLHPVYLNRIFKKERGISLGQFIIAERMKLASELLQTKKLNALTVAKQVGYVSYANFSVMFKKYYGCSPAQYQKEKTENGQDPEKSL